jgi:hypothetical protein
LQAVRARRPSTGPSRKDDPLNLPENFEEVLEAGRAARGLAESPAYKDAMRDLEAYHIGAMVAAPEGPSGVDARDHHHRMLHALRELAGEIAARALAADEIEKALEVQAEEEDEIE